MLTEKAQELSNVIGHSTFAEFRYSVEISEELFKVEKGKCNDLMWILASIYQAGKIEGIRKERARRKEMTNESRKI